MHLLIVVSGIDPQGNYVHGRLDTSSLESGFELLSRLVQSGWQLISVKLHEGKHRCIFLPVEAFDGQTMEEPLQRLQQSWEEALLHTKPN